eukprot:924230-Prorocentrum_minimum.AAC.6
MRGFKGFSRARVTIKGGGTYAAVYWEEVAGSSCMATKRFASPAALDSSGLASLYTLGANTARLRSAPAHCVRTPSCEA